MPVPYVVYYSLSFPLQQLAAHAGLILPDPVAPPVVRGKRLLVEGDGLHQHAAFGAQQAVAGAEELIVVSQSPGAEGRKVMERHAFHGIIAAARVDDDDLAGERRRREAIRDLTCGIARDDTKTQGKRPGHARSDYGTPCLALL